MKNGAGILILLSLLMHPVFCQTARQDSMPIMKNLLKGDLPIETRLKYLTKLCAYYWTIDPDTSIWYGNQGKAYFKEGVSLNRIGRIYFVLGMAWENKGNLDSALYYLGQAEVTSLKAGDTMYHYRTVEQTGSLYRMMGKYDTAVLLMSRSLDYFRSRHKNFYIMTSLFNIGSVYLEQNRYNKALQYYLESASYDTILYDSTNMATHYFGIGTIYVSLGSLFKKTDPEKSKNYLSLSKSYFKKSLPVFEAIHMKTGYCFAMMNLLSVMVSSDELSQADSLLASCRECLEFKDPRVESGFNINRAQILHLRGNDREAKALLARISKNTGEIRILPEFHKAMLLYSELLRNSGQQDSALGTARQSLMWARRHSVLAVALDASRILAEWERKSENYEKAFDYLLIAGQYQDSLSVEIGREIFDQLELSFSNKILKAEIGKLSIEKKYNKTLNLVTVLLASFILILLLIFAVYLQRRRKFAEAKRLIAEERTKLAEEGKHLSDLEIRNMTLVKNQRDLEIQLKDEEMQKLQLEMQLRDQELVYQTMLRVDLTQINRSVQEKLTPFNLKLSSKKDQSEFIQVIQEITREAGKDPLADFEILFTQLHKSFFEKLISSYDSLSKTELQVCAMIRMNLSTKDMARMMNLSVASIDMTRHRIRQKLNLEQKDNLTTFLMGI